MQNRILNLMQPRAEVAGLLGVLGLLSTLVQSGCFHAADDCELNPILGCGRWALLSTSTGVPPVGCIPSENKDPIADTCGLFVSSSRGKDNASGSKSAPLQTLRAAFAKANGRPVYACAESFSGSVTLSGGSSFYGGLDCGMGWRFVGSAKKTSLVGEADAPALTIAKAAGGSEVADVDVLSPPAKMPGSSSIAVLVDEATVTLSRCSLAAGNGADGAAGENAPPMSAAAGKDGGKGGDACSAENVNGAGQVINTCGAENSIGGSGGAGTATNGVPGAPGLPESSSSGQAGQGDNGSAGWSCGAKGGGGGGDSGAPGTPGAGAGMSALGSLRATGFSPAPGTDGLAGKIGQGGGGGGGAKGGSLECNGKPGTGGASGGSGGAGGCGGNGGKGGQGGGASIALVSFKAALSLYGVTLSAANGGKGGTGGDLQLGGPGGLGGLGGSNLATAGLKSACKGGDGGSGGEGGPGGGGRGGHSLGIAYLGTAPVIDAQHITTTSPGSGGLGGNKSLKNNAGTDGLAIPIQAFEP
jgi:hypothetical protein